MMPRPHPWEPNQTPWFTESYSAQMRAKDAVAVTVQRVHAAAVLIETMRVSG